MKIDITLIQGKITDFQNKISRVSKGFFKKVIFEQKAIPTKKLSAARLNMLEFE